MPHLSRFFRHEAARIFTSAIPFCALAAATVAPAWLAGAACGAPALLASAAGAAAVVLAPAAGDVLEELAPAAAFGGPGGSSGASGFSSTHTWSLGGSPVPISFSEPRSGSHSSRGAPGGGSFTVHQPWLSRLLSLFLVQEVVLSSSQTLIVISSPATPWTWKDPFFHIGSWVSDFTSVSPFISPFTYNSQ